MRRNPLTTRRIEREPTIPVAVMRAARDIWHQLPTHDGEKANMYDLLAINGWPTEVIGSGSFAVALVGVQAADTVVKITTDGQDAHVCAHLSELQLRGIHLAGIPKIYRVQKRGKLYAITMERVVPLRSMPIECEDFEREFLDIDEEIAMAYVGNLQTVQRKAIYDIHTKGKLSRKVTDQTLEAMMGFASELRGQAIGELQEELAAQAAAAVETLRDLGIACPDLHSGNWGVRVFPEDNFEMVIIDFGVSSVPPERELNMEVLEP